MTVWLNPLPGSVTPDFTLIFGSLSTWLQDQVVTPTAAWTAYTPTWTSSGTQPAIGNGSLIGRYVLQGKMCTVRIALKGGSTTTVGTGGYTFSLPFTAAATAGEQVLAAELYDGANHYISYGLIGDGGGSSIAPFSLKGGTGGTAPQMSGGTAFAAGLAAFITIQGTYETA